MARLKIGVVISGRGSNLQALIDACTDPDYPAEITLVVSNQPDAAGLERAQRAGIPTAILDHRGFADRAAFEAALTERLEAAGVELVCLAGFMRVLTDLFVHRWMDRLINIHPALLPSFRGVDTHARALKSGVKLHGCTVHFVNPEVDAGPIIGQAAVPVLPGDDATTLAARVLESEHRLLPTCVRLIAEGRVAVAGGVVTIDGATATDRMLQNPA